MNPITVGIIGTGDTARIHASTYLALGHTVKVVADMDPQSAMDFCREMGINHYCQKYQDLLYDRSIQAISVCTPTFLHGEILRACLDAHKHVLLEPPMTMDSTEAQSILEAAARHPDCSCVLSRPYRFKTSSTIVREFLRNPSFGSVYHLHSEFLRRRGTPSPDSWLNRPEMSGGGALMDLGSHVLDLSLHFLDFPAVISVSGSVRSVFGSSLSNPESSPPDMPSEAPSASNVEDHAMALIRLENNITLSLEVAWAANTADSCDMRILGTGSGAQLDFENEQITIFGEQSGFITDSQPVVKPVHPYEEVIHHFANDIQEKQPRAFQSLEQGVGVQRIIDAIYESSRIGREILFS